MKLKELLRVLIYGEMEDISVYEIEADIYDKEPEHGPEIRGLYLSLAGEKRERLKMLRTISKEGTGFRQRDTETPRSLAASLRAHIARALTCVALYNNLIKELKKPEFKAAVKDMVTAERRFLKALRALQTKLKQPA
ncbi:MAG TPA: hypothetical protein DCZ92_15580 [Elusimicrobia bacterium]|nr:MAG: hypothetical protein A2016_12020 [Elusimicrobia bacterium GWF2_62_30]HBA62201.1 hypothetical protein [Elusimicrobiota bacterium]